MKNKRGQLTLFIIIGLALAILLILLFFLLKPSLPIITTRELNPNQYLTQCLEPQIRPVIAELAQNAGYKEPEGYVMHKGKKIKYLCYSSDYYKTCLVQQPMIKSHFEKELNLIVQEKANDCIANLVKEYKKRGYEVTLGTINSNISIIPKKILIVFNTPLTIAGETARKYDSFKIELNSEIYNLLFIAHSIIEYEATYGDSATELYLQYYPNLKIEKTTLSDGTTIYKLSDVITKEEFVFASKSLAWPAGYGVLES